MSYHQRNQGKPTFKNYNNFDDMNNQINQMSLNNNNNNNSKKKAVNYNDFEPDVFTTIYQELRRKMGSNNTINTKEQIGDFIYELAEVLYEDKAGKITGMIREYSLGKLNGMILFDPQEIKKQIFNGHNLIQTVPSSK